MSVELGKKPSWGRNSHSHEMSVSIWISVALSHVMVKKCFLYLDVFRMPWFEEEVRSAVQKASTGGEATALYTQTKLPVLKKEREKGKERTGQEKKRKEKRREEKGTKREERKENKRKEKGREKKKRKLFLAHSYPWF